MDTLCTDEDNTFNNNENMGTLTCAAYDFHLFSISSIKYLRVLPTYKSNAEKVSVYLQ